MVSAALYGNSLLLSGIGASLKKRAGLRIHPIDTAAPDAADQLRVLQPDMVVFDMAAACPDSAIALWKAKPDLLLIGVDLETDRVQIFSGKSSRVLSADAFVDLIGVLALERGAGSRW